MVAVASVEATADFPADFRAATPGGLSAPFMRVPLDSARCLVPGAAPTSTGMWWLTGSTAARSSLAASVTVTRSGTATLG
jgi:hypothetical protein